jgi:glycerol-3-phosphate dehydrogenase
MRLTARAESLAALGDREFDVLVVGGGITGCGIARDAALRGLRVALVEKHDFAAGTSSRSSRLVHGGVRYLEHGRLHLVFESSAERRRLLRLAPHLVRPLAFTWPVYRRARISRWKLFAGLALYDALALFRNVRRHRRLRARDVTAQEPQLRRDGLVGGALYYDAATDDTRLTLANALGAAAAGAVVANYVEVDAFSTTGRPRRIGSAVVVDRLSSREITIRARITVNATGPWSDIVRRLEQQAVGERGSIVQASGPTVRGSVGAHVAVPRERVGNRNAVTLVSPIDGRVMFVLPDGEHTIIGTTERSSTAPPDDVRATEHDVDYLLASANAFFPSARLTRADVVSAWAGIRPLAAADASGDLGSASREHAITRGPGGVITVTGGKLTTYRVMAAQVVDHVERALGRRPRGTPTARLPLPGGDIGSVNAALEEARTATGHEDVAHRLVYTYGSAWRTVWNRATCAPRGTERVVPGLPYLFGEMLYAAEAEMACTIADLLVRRTRLAFETADHGMASAADVAHAVASVLGWDGTRKAVEMDRFGDEVQRIFSVEENG